MFATSDGLRIAYDESGSRDAPALVFLHGVGATKKTWRGQLDALSRRYRCIALDYRGYGGSDVPPDDALALETAAISPQSISRAAFARDVVAVLDAAGVQRAHVVGNSLGGVVAMQLYAGAPHRTASLTLADTFAHYPGGAESIAARIATLRKLGIAAFAAARAPLLFCEAAPAGVVDAARADMASIPQLVYEAATRVTWSGDYRAVLPSVSVPVSVICGERDGIAPLSLSEEIAALVPSRPAVTVIAGAGHVPHLEQPQAFNAAVDAFVGAFI